VLLKGTKVDGVYNSDPKKDRSAKKYQTLSFSQVLADKLAVMDLTAVSLCMENHLPIIVFDLNNSGTLKRIIQGERLGTIVKE